MQRDPRYDILFEPVRIGPVTAKNRFFQVPHCNGMGYAMPEAHAAMRAAKAEGGWAVVSTEECEIHPTGDISPYVEARLWDDSDIPALALLCGLALWPRPTVREARRHPEQVGTSLERAQVAAETRGALGYIGGVLIAASAHTEQIVLNQALPPLRNSFSNARIKLLNHIEP